MSGARPHGGLLRWWRSGPPQPVALAPDEAARRSRRMREVTFASVTIGYAFFYTTRRSLAVAKKPMMDAGLVAIIYNSSSQATMTRHLCSTIARWARS